MLFLVNFQELQIMRFFNAIFSHELPSIKDGNNQTHSPWSAFTPPLHRGPPEETISPSRIFRQTIQILLIQLCVQWWWWWWLGLRLRPRLRSSIVVCGFRVSEVFGRKEFCLFLRPQLPPVKGGGGGGWSEGGASPRGDYVSGEVLRFPRVSRYK